MRFLSLPFLVILLTLSACGSAATTATYAPPNNPGGRLCTGQCGDAKDYCQESCSLNQRQCLGSVQSQALRDYDKYSREQFAAHQPPDLLPHDFERTAPCDDAKKNCLDDCTGRYQSCFENCGGKVNVTTSCQFMCF